MRVGTRAAIVLMAILASNVPACERRDGSTRVPHEAATAVVSLQNIDCQSCGMSVVDALQRTQGVYAASFDRDKAEVTVTFDEGQTGPTAFLAVVADLGYGATQGAGQGVYTPEVEFSGDLDVQQISQEGESIEIESFLAHGKVTVFDFHAVWCGPCRKVDRHMLSVLREHDDVALRKLNVVDWDSPVAKQYLAGVPNLPYVIVYAHDGKRVAKISGLKLDDLDAAIEKGRRR